MLLRVHSYIIRENTRDTSSNSNFLREILIENDQKSSKFRTVKLIISMKLRRCTLLRFLFGGNFSTKYVMARNNSRDNMLQGALGRG